MASVPATVVLRAPVTNAEAGEARAEAKINTVKALKELMDRILEVTLDKVMVAGSGEAEGEAEGGAPTEEITMEEPILCANSKMPDLFS